jgi:hypothetical protein
MTRDVLARGTAKYLDRRLTKDSNRVPSVDLSNVSDDSIAFHDSTTQKAGLCPWNTIRDFHSGFFINDTKLNMLLNHREMMQRCSIREIQFP